MTSVGVVVLDLDQAPITVRCLRSLSSGTRRPDIVVLVENSRTPVPATGAYGFPVVVLQPGINLGCGGGRNLGLNYLRANTSITTFVILDNDTVAHENFIERLQLAPPSSLQVIAPLIYNFTNGGVWSSGGTLRSDGAIDQLTTLIGTPQVVDWAPGACLIFDRTTWDVVGPFDAWLQFLFEDIEWCCRLRQAGGTVVVMPNLRVRHEAHQSLGGRWSPARVRYWARNGTVLRATTLRVGGFHLLKWLAQETVLSVSDVFRGRGRWAAARFYGLFEGVAALIQRRAADPLRHEEPVDAYVKEP